MWKSLATEIKIWAEENIIYPVTTDTPMVVVGKIKPIKREDSFAGIEFDIVEGFSTVVSYQKGELRDCKVLISSSVLVEGVAPAEGQLLWKITIELGGYKKPEELYDRFAGDIQEGLRNDIHPETIEVTKVRPAQGYGGRIIVVRPLERNKAEALYKKLLVTLAEEED